MHILFITHYYEPDSGAAAVRLSRLAKLLKQKGHTITILTTIPHYPQGEIQSPYRGKFSTDEDRDGIRVIQMWLWATPSKSIIKRLLSQLSFMITCALRGLFLPRPDVIFIENQPIFTGLAGWFISLVKRRSYLINVSDYWPEYLLAVGVLTERHLLYRAFRALVNLTQGHASALVALLPGLLRSVEKRIGKHQAGHVIMNAVDLERFRPDLDTQPFRQKYNLGNQKLITFVGTFGNHIDLDTMLDTAAYFDGHADVTFVFIGTGINRETLDARVDTLQNTKWIGWIDHDEMPLAWAASYLTYWAVHEHELNRISFQSKLYEALASGTPPVVAVEGIISEVLAVAEAGQTVPFGDKDGLIQKIAYLLDNQDAQLQMSQDARQYAEAHFDPHIVAEKYEAILERIATG